MTINSKISKYKSCPCGSFNKAKFCCAMHRIWFKPPALVTTAGGPTGISNPKCYLNATADCDSKITGEHFISKGLLSQMSTNDTAKIAGLSWQTPETFDIVGIKSLVSNILCKRHNESLSPLDKESARFFGKLYSYQSGQQSSVKIVTEEFNIFSGFDIERWLLKALAGLLASKNWKTYSCNINYSELLTAPNAWPAGAGMYVQTNAPLYQTHSLLLCPAVKTGTLEIAGLQASICGLDLILALDPTFNWNESSSYRPSSLHFRARRVVKTLMLTWDGKYRGPELLCDRQAQEFAGNPPNWLPWERT